MITVYFENESPAHADIVAMFNTEALYHECLPVLEAYAAKHRMIVTESVTEIEISEVYNSGVKNNVPLEEIPMSSIKCKLCWDTGYILSTFPCFRCKKKEIKSHAVIPKYFRCAYCYDKGYIEIIDHSFGKGTRNVKCEHCDIEKTQQDAAEAMVPVFYKMSEIIDRGINLALEKNVNHIAIYLMKEDHQRLVDEFNSNDLNGFKYKKVTGYQNCNVFVINSDKSYIYTEKTVPGSILYECFNLYTGEKL